MKVILACIADHAVVDSSSKLSAIGIFDAIHAAAVPATHPKMFFIFRLMLEHDDAGTQSDMLMRLVDEDGGVAMEVRGHVDAPADIPTGSFAAQNGVFELVNVVFPRAGRYVFEITAGKNPPVQTPFDVRIPK